MCFDFLYNLVWKFFHYKKNWAEYVKQGLTIIVRF